MPHDRLHAKRFIANHSMAELVERRVYVLFQIGTDASGFRTNGIERTNNGEVTAGIQSCGSK
jgi:hypothetical protein